MSRILTDASLKAVLLATALSVSVAVGLAYSQDQAPAAPSMENDAGDGMAGMDMSGMDMPATGGEAPAASMPMKETPAGSMSANGGMMGMMPMMMGMMPMMMGGGGMGMPIPEMAGQQSAAGSSTADLNKKLQALDAKLDLLTQKIEQLEAKP